MITNYNAMLLKYKINKKNKLFYTNDSIINNEYDVFYNQFKNDYKYNKINNILNDNNLTLYEKQYNIENFIKNMWFDNIKSKLSINETNKESFVILYNLHKKLDKEINVWKNNGKYWNKKKRLHKIIFNLSSIEIISCVISNIIPYLYNYEFMVEGNNLTTLLQKIGKNVIYRGFNNYYYKYLSQYNIEYNKKTVDIVYKENNISNESILKYDDFNIIRNNLRLKFKNEFIKDLLEDDHILIGDLLVEFLNVKTDLFTLENKWSNNEYNDYKLFRVMKPQKDFYKLIEDIVLLNNQTIPMIFKPIDWEVDIDNNDGNYKIKKYGGYVQNSGFYQDSFINKSSKNLGESKLYNDTVIKSINKLSSIQFTINSNVLDAIIYLLKNNNTNIYKYIKLFKHLDSEHLSTYINNSDIEKVNTIQEHNNCYYISTNILSTALLFNDWCNSSKDNSIYFPYFLDWRGRHYTRNSIFSLQGSELSKSLIMFKNGERLNKLGVESLKVYIANCYGLKKLSYNNRLAWCENNLNNIINIDYDYIFKASEPFLFLAASLELKNHISDINYISRLPIYADATCNGIQHLCAMSNEISLFKYVNISISSKDDIPADIYDQLVPYVIDIINEVINDPNKILNTNNKKSKNKIRTAVEIDKLKDEYQKLSLIKIDRSFIKRTIMTIPYGISAFGIKDQLINDFFYLRNFKINNRNSYSVKDSKYIKDNSEVFFTSVSIFKLAEILHNVLYNTFPNLSIFVEWLKKINNMLKKLNLAPIWMAPSGLIIEQKYVIHETKILSRTLLGKSRSISIKKPIINKINLRGQNAGIVPNLVHSFDASNVAKLMESLNTKYNIEIFTIHDCFATNANHIELLKFQVKNTFLCLYSNNNFIDTYYNFIRKIIELNQFIIITDKDTKEEFILLTTNDNIYNSNNFNTINENILRKNLVKMVPKLDLNKDIDGLKDVLNSEYFLH